MHRIDEVALGLRNDGFGGMRTRGAEDRFESAVLDFYSNRRADGWTADGIARYLIGWVDRLIEEIESAELSADPARILIESAKSSA